MIEYSQIKLPKVKQKIEKKVYICSQMDSITDRKSSQDKVESFLLKVKAVAYSLLNLKDLFRVIRLRNHYGGIQLRPAEIIKIVHATRKFEHCNMLIFGLGNDSPFWCEINSKGRTVFLEDFQPWYDKITGKFPEIEAYPVAFPCNITQWQEVLEQPERLEVDLPKEVSQTSWDVILVDGPRGHQYSEKIPGRMSSIYISSRLVGKGGYIFVHDAERRVEKTYAAKYLSEADHVEKVRGRAFMLIHRFPR